MDSDPKNLNPDLDSRKMTVDLNPDSNPDSNFRVPVDFKLLDADRNPTKLTFHCSVISVVIDARLCVKLICILKKKPVFEESSKVSGYVERILKLNHTKPTEGFSKTHLYDSRCRDVHFFNSCLSHSVDDEKVWAFSKVIPLFSWEKLFSIHRKRY